MKIIDTEKKLDEFMETKPKIIKDVWFKDVRFEHLRFDHVEFDHVWFEYVGFKDTPIIQFQGGKNMAFFFRWSHYLQIGCEYHTLYWWLLNWERVGKDNDYSKQERELYHEFMWLCVEAAQ